jgi:uncharacterized membrane protein HdeD (DUF308 family)
MRWMTPLVLGAAMFLLGLFIALRPLFTHFATFTSSRWLDMTFALLFLLRGWLNVKTALRRRDEPLAQR